MTFNDLNLIEPILRSLRQEGYEKPTPVQAQSIPSILRGNDLLGCAQTGTGKTAAFAIPILQVLSSAKPSQVRSKPIRSLILTPTRELAIQIDESFRAYGRHLPLRCAVIFGGVSQNKQTQTLKKGVDILVATPGRLLDLMQQGYIDLRQLKIFVLDEADRMLDMGFVHDVKRVIKKLPEKRQTLFFSATMPPDIVELSDRILNKPVKVEVTPVSSTAESIRQSIYFVDKANKKALLAHLLQDDEIESALIFTRTKHAANRVSRDLSKVGITADAIHGNKSQNARQNALQNFKSKQTRVLVATDIAARGIDVDELSHVINFDLPNVPETYVHRIGRTGRAGADGIAFSFCDQEEKSYLASIHKLIDKRIAVVDDHPYPLGSAVKPKGSNQSQQPTNQRRPRTDARKGNFNSGKSGR
jgi:ATP-dependent RNA helicase RhlE